MNLKGKRILVIGGTGSLGQALISRLLKGEMGRPAKIIVFSRDEAKQYQMRLDYLRRRAATEEIAFMDRQGLLSFRIGDVRDYASVLSHLREADVVFNVAAMKQVPICEYAPFEGILTNVVGAQNIVRAIRENNLAVELVVGISTDKACKPVNVMGMTKALQERLFAQANLGNGRTRFVCVRYGNVIGSRGSVIPLFLERIRTGGPVPITTESMTRFLLPMDQAVDTVFAAVRSARPGETYVPKVHAARIVDIARVLIDGRDIPLTFTGIRPGEKIHETLVSEEECFRTTQRDGYYVIAPILPEIREAADAQPALTSEYSSDVDLLGLDELKALLAPYRDTAEVSATGNGHKVQEAPLVSVVIPSYNRAGFVGEAIESALGQTHQSLEVIVVDDGSTDDTDKVMERYADNRKVRYVKHPANRGIPAARNTGIRQARGEYIAFLDSDDMWLPSKLEAQLGVFSRDVTKEIGVVWSNAYVTDTSGHTRTNGGSVPREINVASCRETLRLLFRHNFVTAQTAMARRSCFDRVGLLDEGLRGGADDYDLWMRLAPHFRFNYVEAPLATVRLHGGNYSSEERQSRDDLVIIEKAIATNPELAALKRAKLARMHYRLGVSYLREGNGRKAKEQLWQAVKWDPVAIKPLVAWVLACCGSVGGLGLKTWLKLRDLTTPDFRPAG